MKLPGSMIVVGIAVVTSGCIKEPTGKSATLVGRYSLALVAGSPPPLTTYSAMLSPAKLEVIGGELVSVSRSRMLDIVEYQATSELGVKQTPYRDTVALTYELDGSTLTITRTRGNVEPTVETWAIADGVLSGMRPFKHPIGLTAPYATVYTTVE